MLPIVEHGRDFALDVTLPGESEDLSDALEGNSGFARGVAGLCILSDSIYTNVAIAESAGRQEDKPAPHFPEQSRQQKAGGKGEGATWKISTGDVSQRIV